MAREAVPPMSDATVPFRDWVGSAYRLLLDRLGTLGKFLGGVLMALFLGGLLYSAVLNAWTWLQVFFLVVFLAVDGYMLSVLFDQGLRRRVFLWLIRDDVLGWHFPIVAVGIVFFLLAIAIFSTSAVLFQGWGLMDLRDPSCAPPCVIDTGAVANFYTWHLAEAVPLLQVNETLHWTEPLVYRGALAGWLVLGFKIAVILPLVQSIRIYWKVRSEIPRLRLRAWPRVIREGVSVTISWASAPPPSGYAFDVYVEKPPAEEVQPYQGWVADHASPEHASDREDELRQAWAQEALGERWTTWLAGQTGTSSEYTPSGPGVFRFQAQWRDTATGKMSSMRKVSIRSRPGRDAGFPREALEFEVSPYPGFSDSAIAWSGGGTPPTGKGRTFATAFSQGGLYTVTARCGDAKTEFSVTICPIDEWLARARSFYGPSIDFSKVTLKGSRLVLGPSGTGWTCNDVIRFKRPHRAEDLPSEATLIHELGHVWEHQSGQAQLLKGFVEQVGRLVGRDPYDFGGLSGVKRAQALTEFSKESQAQVITEYWKSNNGYEEDRKGIPFSTPGYVEDLRRLVEGAGIGAGSSARRTIVGRMDAAVASLVNALVNRLD